jgi:uncharacterized protein (DUF433 family)
MLSKPVIRGTRTPVELVIRKVSQRTTEADALDSRPRLNWRDSHAAGGYAAESLAHEASELEAA